MPDIYIEQMTELEDRFDSFDASRPKPFIIIALTLAAVFLGFQLIGPLIGFFLYIPFYPDNLMSAVEALQSPVKHPEVKMLLFVMQGVGACIGLILIPFFIRKWSKTEEKILDQPFFFLPFILVIGIVIVFMGLNSVFIEWNQNFKFPEALGWEESLRSMENRLTELTAFLTTYDSTAQIVVAFIVIAILPAIGEELVFRGIIQKELFRGTKNSHLSIWIAAAIFSAIHLQFYGFVPRMLLGVLFGYLYHWSGNLTLSMLAHFVNNGFTVVALYLHQQKIIDIDIENTESVPWQGVLFSAIFTAVLLYTFRKYYQQKNLTPSV
ncbi:MAG TPA: type II CAAX endopeptidase family protein [Chryseolinea sp.]|nr:type II CAAX endopeptidase family protein [Chryseolinea sp.]HPM29383.1 type II CAAX endopeptidase family protein [Chryseolinea sp.]